MWTAFTMLAAFVVGAAGGRWYQSRENDRYERDRAGLTVLKERLNEAVRVAARQPATVKRAAAFEAAQASLNNAWRTPTNAVAVYSAKADVAAACDKAGVADKS